MRSPDLGSGVDPVTLAAVARRLAVLLPTQPDPVATAGWQGRAAVAARAAPAPVLEGYGSIRLALLEAAAVLSATAAALDAAQQLAMAADRLEAVEPPADPDGLPGRADPLALAAVVRLRADAADQVARADAACAARLRALAVVVVPSLPVPAPVRSPEQLQLTGLAWGSVPAALVGPVAALTAEATADDVHAPAEAREIAARIVLAGRPGLVGADGDGAEREYLQAGPDGRIAEVWGEVSTARDVLVVVPGTTVSEASFGSAQQMGDAAYDAMRAQVGAAVAAVAVVVWLGSPEPPDVLRAALQSYAERAAPLLRDFVQALPLAPGARLTLAGHSYGAVVAGLAVRAGLRPAVLLGIAPAGFGPPVRDGEDLDGVPTAVIEAAHDPIQDEFTIQSALRRVLPEPVDAVTSRLGVGHLGADPVCMPHTEQLASGDDGRSHPLSFDIDLHSSYFAPGSETLAQIAAVATGSPVVPAPPGRCPGAAAPPAH